MRFQVLQLVDAFGANRLIWGSDFPFVVQECGYSKAGACVSCGGHYVMYRTGFVSHAYYVDCSPSLHKCRIMLLISWKFMTVFEMPSTCFLWYFYFVWLEPCSTSFEWNGRSQWRWQGMDHGEILGRAVSGSVGPEHLNTGLVSRCSVQHTFESTRSPRLETHLLSSGCTNIQFSFLFTLVPCNGFCIIVATVLGDKLSLVTFVTKRMYAEHNTGIITPKQLLFQCCNSLDICTHCEPTFPLIWMFTYFSLPAVLWGDIIFQPFLSPTAVYLMQNSTSWFYVLAVSHTFIECTHFGSVHQLYGDDRRHHCK